MITTSEERERQRSFIVHGLPLGDQQPQQHTNEASSSNVAAVAETAQNRRQCDDSVRLKIETLLGFLGVHTSPQQMFLLQQQRSNGQDSTDTFSPAVYVVQFGRNLLFASYAIPILLFHM